MKELKRLFDNGFIKQFVCVKDAFPFSNEELKYLDAELETYDQLFLDPEIEKSLIHKNALLTSFALSKAENSSLTLSEAQEIYKLTLDNPDYAFLRKKIIGKKLGEKEYEKLEFLNIKKTFDRYNQKLPAISDITPDYLRELHHQLTQGLDIFQPYLKELTLYKSGKWRDNDTIRVGNYIPAPHADITDCLKELLAWLYEHQTITAVGIFHTTLYAIHPFNNGNKRVARMLEHLLLRALGLNTKNLYSTSQYYHQEKLRYYKYLLYSLEKKNITYFTSFFQEALALSIISTVQKVLEAKRANFVNASDLDDYARLILKPLISKRELQFKTLFKHVHRKMARQTFVTRLQQATEQGIITKRQQGKAVYYRLTPHLKEESTFDQLLDSIKKKLPYIPDSIKLA